ncbi:MAG: PP2C family serine/threonine-protein phosphatase [Acidimicrobiales bacterium]
MSAEVETDADVSACPQCQSPVFHDELFCEACGRRVGEEAPPAAAVPAVTATDRNEHDAGSIGGVTDRGRRRLRNEDAMAIGTVDGRLIAAVCDGVASTANPDQAAREAADAAFATLEPLLHAPVWPATEVEGLLEQAFAAAQRAVMEVPDDEPDGNDLSPSTTMVVAVAAEGRITIANIGDSRAYWLSPDPGQARLLTVDDSWAQESIAEGSAVEVAYAHPEAHTITRWVGADADSVVPTIVTLDVTAPGLLVLCTDGLWNYFEDPGRLGALVPDRDTSSPIVIARCLTDAALAAGGQDNVTVVVAPVGPTASGPGQGPTEE